MKLTFLGTGSAFTVLNSQSNMLLEHGNKKMLLDCGGDVRRPLHFLGLNFNDIDEAFVSHLHTDHNGGFEGFALSTFFTPPLGEGRPVLYSHSKVLSDLWTDSLRGGLGTLQNRIAELDTYFDVRRIEDNGHIVLNGGIANLVQVVHYMHGNIIVPSYGLMFVADNGYKAFWTSDAQHCPNQIKDWYVDADIIFQDCETTFPSGVHAHYDDLKNLPPEIKAKMWLYHYADSPKPDCIADGFAGWIISGQSFDLTGETETIVPEAPLVAYVSGLELKELKDEVSKLRELVKAT